MQKNIFIIIICIIGLSLTSFSIAFAAPCIGNNFEQQVPPVPDVKQPMVSIEAPTTVTSGANITLTANAVADIDNGANPFFFWCVQGAEIELDPNFSDFSTIRLTVPNLETEVLIRVSVQLGDDLGYVDTDTVYINVQADQMADSDSDGLPDAWEMENFGDLDQDQTTDFDGDGIKDIDEYKYGLDPTTDDAAFDADGDGYTNLEEIQAGTDPNDPDDAPDYFKADCDYTVPGDFSTIADALDAAKQMTGVTICVEPGEYEQTKTLKIYGDTWLVACGEPAETVIKGDGKGTVITFQNGQAGGIVGFTVTGSKDKGNASAIDTTGNDTPVIANNIIKGNLHGIATGGNSSPLIISNTIADNAGDGIHTNGNGQAAIEKNIITGNQGDSISCNGQDTLIVSGNLVFGNGADETDCFTMSDTTLADPSFTDSDYHQNAYPEIGAYGDRYLVCGTPVAELPETITHTITATTSAGGSIAPSGDVTVAQGEDQSFIVTAESGYYLSSIKIDGMTVSATDTYTFPAVMGDHAIHAVFTELNPVVIPPIIPTGDSSDDDSPDNDADDLDDGTDDNGTDDNSSENAEEDGDSGDTGDNETEDADDTINNDSGDTGEDTDGATPDDDDNDVSDGDVSENAAGETDEGPEDTNAGDNTADSVDETGNGDSYTQLGVGYGDETVDDSDGDGTPDTYDIEAADATTASVEAATGTGEIIIDTTDSEDEAPLTDVAAVSDADATLNQNNRPAGYHFTHGMIRFKAHNSNGHGKTVQVTLTFPDIIPPNAECFKVNADGFYRLDEEYYDVIDNLLILYLTDGGAGDDDGVADGVVTDPVGIATPAVTAEATEETVTPSGEGGGGGCFIDSLSGQETMVWQFIMSCMMLCWLINFILRKRRGKVIKI